MKKFFLRVSGKEQGLKQAAHDLSAGKSRNDVLETAVRVLELDPADDSVGYGGFPNLLGAMELDGAFMDGDSRNCGSVAGITNFLPVAVARRLMQCGLHTFLLGHGAEIFAQESGLQPEQTLSDAQREKWEREIKPVLDGRGSKSLMDIVRHMTFPGERNWDTTVMFASDGMGLSGAASTAGWPYKHPGRAGDTPIIGAGLYVDSRYGGAACTHTGEMSTRTGMARFVVAQLEFGKPPRDAVRAAIDNLSHLSGGLLRTLVVYAIDRDGDAHAAAVNAGAPIFFQYWHKDLTEPERRQAEAVSLFPRAGAQAPFC